MKNEIFIGEKCDDDDGENEKLLKKLYFKTLNL